MTVITAAEPPRMTLGEAVDWLSTEPFGCACPGPPPGFCCFDKTLQAQALVRAGHIAIKQVDEWRVCR